MGISGLLPFVKKSCRPSKIDEFYGKTVAVDACCWLHKGAFGCAENFVHYCLKYVKMLLSYKMHVILVFDGASLPAKQHTDAERKKRRHSMKMKGKSYLAEGKVNEANECFKKCCEITFEMISSVIEACSCLPNVDCIIAPYESDAQLAYFDKEEIVQLIITEDSDLIVYGCTNIMKKISSVLRMPGIVVTDDFVEKFIEAENTFLYQIVFDIVSKQTKQLNSCCEGDCQCERRPYAGRIVDKNLAYQLAIGNVHPVTHQKVNNFDPACKVGTSRSIWNGNFCPSADNVDFDDTVASQISEKSPKISAFTTSTSRFISTSSNRQRNSSQLRKQDDGICQDYNQNDEPRTPPVCTPKVPVVSRHFSKNPFSIAKSNEKSPERKDNTEKSALELLASEDEGARLSDSFIKSPLSLMRTQIQLSANSSSGISHSETETPDSGKILPCKMRDCSSSPVFSRNKKRILVISPASSTNVEITGKCLRKFCYVSPKKLFDRTAGMENDCVKANSSCELSDINFSQPICSGSSASSADSGLGKINESSESLNNIIDLTGEDDHDNLKEKDISPVKFPTKSKYLQKCKPLGLGKPTPQKSKSYPNLKQANIKELFSAYAYKK